MPLSVSTSSLPSSGVVCQSRPLRSRRWTRRRSPWLVIEVEIEIVVAGWCSGSVVSIALSMDSDSRLSDLCKT